MFTPNTARLRQSFPVSTVPKCKGTSTMSFGIICFIASWSWANSFQWLVQTAWNGLPIDLRRLPNGACSQVSHSSVLRLYVYVPLLRFLQFFVVPLLLCSVSMQQTELLSKRSSFALSSGVLLFQPFPDLLSEISYLLISLVLHVKTLTSVLPLLVSNLLQSRFFDHLSYSIAILNLLRSSSYLSLFILFQLNYKLLLLQFNLCSAKLFVRPIRSSFSLRRRTCRPNSSASCSFSYLTRRNSSCVCCPSLS